MLNIWYFIINLIIIIASSLVLSLQDLKKYSYSYWILIVASWFVLISHLVFNFNESYLYLFRALVGFAFYYCIRRMSKDKLAWGDIFFGAFSAFCLPNLVYFIISIFIELITAYLFILILDKKNKKINILPEKLPFIPFMALALFLSYLIYFIFQIILLAR